MFWFLHRRTTAKQSPPPQNNLRSRIGLEPLEGREVPAVVTFTFSLGDTSYGMVSFDYADAQVDPELASQQLSVNDTQILIDGQSVVEPANAFDTITALKCWPSPSTSRCVHSSPAAI